MPNVKVIPQKLKRKKATRVAAYTRVSSPKAEMIASLSAQVDYYNNLITANPDWELCGIYVDEAKIPIGSCAAFTLTKRKPAQRIRGKISGG